MTTTVKRFKPQNGAKSPRRHFMDLFLEEIKGLGMKQFTKKQLFTALDLDPKAKMRIICNYEQFVSVGSAQGIWGGYLFRYSERQHRLLKGMVSHGLLNIIDDTVHCREVYEIV